MPKATTNYPTSVVNGRRNNNNGWHPKGKRAYRNAERTIIECLHYFREPRLYHIVFSGGTSLDHRKALNALCQRLSRKNIDHEWFGARENSQKRGEHLHVFIIVDSDGTPAQSVLNTFSDTWLTSGCLKNGIHKPYINKPQNTEIHGLNRYAQLPYLGPRNRATEQAIVRLLDALDWLSYIFKMRDKHTGDWENEGQIFPASRPSRRKTLRRAAHAGSVESPRIETGDALLDQLIGKNQTALALGSAERC